MRFTEVVLTLTMFFVSLTGLYAQQNDVYNDLNQGVGNYDYMPYRSNTGGSIDFHVVLGDYGQWMTVPRFGQVWRPYAAAGWRPFTNGHWVTTQSGQTWQGYEPWSWAADHYGNWIYDPNYGWVLVPSNTYSPGQVAWSYSQDSIGWAPAPPYGYDYSQGYLGYRGANNQFSFADSGFGINVNFSNQDSRYQPLFYNSAYMGMAPNLWNFVGRNQFVTDNYGGLYLSPSQVRELFNQRRLFITGAPLQRDRLERIIGQQVVVVPVRYQDITMGGHRSRYVIPVGEEDHLRRNSRVVIERAIAPGFAKSNKKFVGQAAQKQNAVAKQQQPAEVQKQHHELAAQKQNVAPKQQQQVEAQKPHNEQAAQKQNVAAKQQQQAEVQKQHHEQAVQKQNAAAKQQQQVEAQKQHNEQAAQKQSATAEQKHREEVSAAQKTAHEQDAVKPAHTQDSKDKNSKAKSKKQQEPPPPAPSEERF